MNISLDDAAATLLALGHQRPTRAYTRLRGDRGFAWRDFVEVMDDANAFMRIEPSDAVYDRDEYECIRVAEAFARSAAPFGVLIEIDLPSAGIVRAARSGRKVELPVAVRDRPDLGPQEVLVRDALPLVARLAYLLPIEVRVLVAVGASNRFILLSEAAFCDLSTELGERRARYFRAVSAMGPKI